MSEVNYVGRLARTESFELKAWGLDGAASSSLRSGWMEVGSSDRFQPLDTREERWEEGWWRTRQAGLNDF